MPVSDQAQHTDVVIVGAGPTGLFLAAQLLRWNVDFIILDLKPSRSEHSKAIAVQALSLELFDELGLANKFISSGLKAQGLRLIENGTERANIDLSAIGKGMSAFPYVLSIPQHETERILVDYLEKSGKSVEWNSKFIACETTNDSITSEFSRGDEQIRIHSKFFVGCDGASSTVRRQAGFTFAGSTNPRHFYVADITVRQTEVSADRLNMILIPGSFILYFPLPEPNTFRIVGELPQSLQQAKTFDEVKDFVISGTELKIDIEKCDWFSTYSVHTRMAEQFSSGRIFLAGDAAHVHTPAGGQGMNTGISDSYNLAWKLALAVKTGNLQALRTYSEERTAFARRLLRTTDRLFAFMTAESAFKQWLRRTVFPIVLRLVTRSALLKKRIFPIISQIGFGYQTGFLEKSHNGKVKAGSRLTFFVTDSGAAILQLLKDPAYKLLTMEPENVGSTDLLKIVQLSANDFRRLGIDKKNTCVLLRPDNYVFQVGTLEEIRKSLVELHLIN